MKFHFRRGAQTHAIEITPKPNGALAMLNGEAIEVQASYGREMELVIAGRPLRVVWAKQGHKTWVHVNGRAYELERTAGNRAGGQAAGAERSLRAPMPGQVLKVLVEPGQAVAAGALLALLEAMKMEVRILAPQAAKVAQVAVTEGQSVEKDQLLVELEPDAG